MLKDHHTETTVLVLALVMGLLMAVAVMLLDGVPFNISNVFKIWAMITLVILLASIFIPYKSWSAKFCETIGLKQGSLGWKLADGIIPSLILNTCNTLIVSGANVFYNEAIPTSEQLSHWMQGCIRDWPITFGISYFVAFLAEACGKRVADSFAEKS
jgi:membrane protease YdiL (CAAX protease family)